VIIWQASDNNWETVNVKKKLSKHIDIGFSFEDIAARKLMVKMDRQSD
jgi:hypothetical protein